MLSKFITRFTTKSKGVIPATMLRGFSSKTLSPNHVHVVLESDYNRDHLLSDVTKIFHGKDLDLRYIDGKVLNKEADGSEKVRMNISFVTSQEEQDMEYLQRELIKNGLRIRKSEVPVKEWFPSQELDLDMLGEELQVPGDGLNQDHPGFTDKVYKERRNLISENSIGYKMGEPIKNFDYSQEETELWGFIWDKLHPLLKAHGCTEYNKNFDILVEAGLFQRDQIPQLEDLNQFLQEKSNWRIKPVNGILSQREFLNALAFRTFCCTQYIRHGSKPEYTPEPDILHEFMGHIPMFSDPLVCDISQLIGILSLGASDAQVAQLGSIYWFTIEFGLCWEEGQRKFYGAGVASSYGEIQNMVQSQELRELDLINAPPPVDFVVQDVQPFYYIAKSFADVLEQLEDLGEHWHKSFELSYDVNENGFLPDRQVIMKERPEAQEGLSF